tara:strand:+ start:4275 stop:4907 length:633 start_codon:yes stop_codon:yes gene_type:complete
LAPGPSPITAEVFQNIANVSRETMERLEIYAELLRRRQNVQNLVSRHSLSDLWGRHMLDSFQLTAHLPRDAGSITDIGAGAGFPGLVLSIVTGLPVTLVESRGRKCKFLQEVINATGAPATVKNSRVEVFADESTQNSVDILTARAVAPLSKLCGMAESLGARTCLFQKGAQWQGELTEACKRWKMHVETFESWTSPDARILRITELTRK